MKHPDNPRRAKNNSAPALTDEYNNEEMSMNNKRGPTKRYKYDDINNIKRLILERV